MVAVSLAACGGDSDGGSASDTESDTGNSGDDGGGDDVTQIPDGGTFVVSDFPKIEEPGLFFKTDGGGFASASDVVELLNSALAAIDTGQTGDAGGDITTGDIQIIIDGLEDNDGDGTPVINIGGGEGQTNVDQLLTLLNSDLLAGGELLQVNQVEIGRVVLTPGDASDTIFPEGSTPGDGNDTILMGQTELLHGAFIDAGGGQRHAGNHGERPLRTAARCAECRNRRYHEPAQPQSAALCQTTSTRAISSAARSPVRHSPCSIKMFWLSSQQKTTPGSIWGLFAMLRL